MVTWCVGTTAGGRSRPSAAVCNPCSSNSDVRTPGITSNTVSSATAKSNPGGRPRMPVFRGGQKAAWRRIIQPCEHFRRQRPQNAIVVERELVTVGKNLQRGKLPCDTFGHVSVHALLNHLRDVAHGNFAPL